MIEDRDDRYDQAVETKPLPRETPTGVFLPSRRREPVMYRVELGFGTFEKAVVKKPVEAFFYDFRRYCQLEQE